ncbi:MAG: AAA family ATPase, partial [Chloroflexi bacterium]|nr:AAA family ATPase [Chloroflexota bacterium]
MLVGEPGIGKTRTAQELATYAGLRGAQVLWGRCYEEQGAPPYWPWVQAIRSYVREKEPEELRSEMGAGAEDIAEIISDVRERLPGLRTPPQLEPEQARFRLFDSITAFLKSASRRQPLVLVLDDLHWADHPSLLLLEFVARELSGSRLLLVGTYRDMELSRRHPLSLTLGELTRERLFQRVLLRGLSQEDVGRFIELVSGFAPPRGMVEAVHRQTEGNPLFVTEVVRLLVQEGEVGARHAVPLRDSDTWSVRIPEGVREVIGRRLDRLSERCNETLTIASVIGREFTLEHLRPLIEDMTEDRLLEVLEEALAARVIEELPQAVGRYQFTHALIQETLAGELSTTRKVRLHARIAVALEELYSDNIEAHAAELAHHFAEAQTALGTDKLIIYSSLAGERALATYAYEEALAHIQRGLAAKEVPLTGSQPAQDLQEADLLFGLVRAQVATLEFHELHEAVVTIGRAFEFYSESGEVDRAVAVAEVSFIGPPGHRTGVAGLLARALALVPPDSHPAGRLLSRYSRALAMEEGDDEGSRKAFDGAMAIARQEGDTVLEMRTWAVGAEADMNYLRRHDALEKALRALGLARDADDPLGELTARFFAVLSLRETGNPEEAERHALVLLDIAERLKGRTNVALALHGNESINSFQGNWNAARSYSDRGLVSGSFTPVFLGMRAHLEYEIGNSAQGDINFRAFVEMIRGIPLGPGLLHAQAALVIPLVGRIIGRLDGADLARQAAEAVISSTNSPPACTGIARAGLALLETLEGHISEVRKHYEDLKVWQGATVHFVALSGDRLLGILAQAMGETDQAVAHFEDALAFCRKAGYRPELAWS